MRTSRGIGTALAIGIGCLWLLGGPTGCDEHAVAARPAPAPADVVVLVTVDGVRASDLFAAVDPAGPPPVGSDASPGMPWLVGEAIPTGTFLGAPGLGAGVTLGNPLASSIPSYQSIFVGRLTPCFGNECNPTTSETLFERVRRDLGLPRERVAVFVTLAGLCERIAADQDADATCGPEEIKVRWNERLGPTRGERTRFSYDDFDRMVGELALDRVADRPALLYVAFDSTDAAGHAGDYTRYVAALREYDAWLRALVARLDGLEDDGARVVLMVTTDHGRGRGPAWTDHGWWTDGSDELWLFARGSGIAARGAIAGRRTWSLHDIRPTIEVLLGLAPTTGWLRGEVIDDLFDAAGPPSD